MMQPASNKVALLVGATGLVGRDVLKHLLEDDTYAEVVVLTRKKTNQSHPKLTQHVVDFDNLEEYRHLIKANHVYCCLGTTLKKAQSKENFYKVDCQYPAEIAKIARFNGTCVFSIVTAMCASKNSTFYYNRVKGEVEDIITHLQFKSCNIFRPSVLLGDREEFRLGEEIGKAVAKRLDFIMVGSLKKYRAIRVEALSWNMLEITKKEKNGVSVYESDQMNYLYEEHTHNTPQLVHHS